MNTQNRSNSRSTVATQTRSNIVTQAQYAIAFDLDTKAMKAAGLQQSEITNIYQKEIPGALKNCGFTAHPQGSLYHTQAEADQLNAIMTLQGTLQQQAPSFCRYVKRVHVFRMEAWSDVTTLIAGHPADGTPTAEEEVAQQEELDEV
jgi:virulence-associated protein VapD